MHRIELFGRLLILASVNRNHDFSFDEIAYAIDTLLQTSNTAELVTGLNFKCLEVENTLSLALMHSDLITCFLIRTP